MSTYFIVMQPSATVMYRCVQTGEVRIDNMTYYDMLYDHWLLLQMTVWLC